MTNFSSVYHRLRRFDERKPESKISEYFQSKPSPRIKEKKYFYRKIRYDLETVRHCSDVFSYAMTKKLVQCKNMSLNDITAYINEEENGMSYPRIRNCLFYVTVFVQQKPFCFFLFVWCFLVPTRLLPKTEEEYPSVDISQSSAVVIFPCNSSNINNIQRLVENID